MWPHGTFLAAYTGNRNETIDNVIDADPVASAVRSLIATRSTWTGTATQLLIILSELTGEADTRSTTWPRSARALAGRLRRAATFLRTVEIDIVFSRKGPKRNRTITISGSPENAGTRPSIPSVSSGFVDGRLVSGDRERTSSGTVDRAEDANRAVLDGSANMSVSGQALRFEAQDGVDGADARIRLSSSEWKARI